MNHRTLRPEELVQQQLEAHNARDIDAFLACWAEDAQYYQHPDKLLASGKAELREYHIALFREPSLFAERVKRIVVANQVVDQLRVTRNFPNGRGSMDVLVSYEISQGKIARAWMTVGPCVVDEGVL
ncbi:Uncharacterized conserved protein [Serratia rubidaea]|uniref:Uncharacterized conserved protein n=1 Tax=Serratia rubidaea TaxID=61652 RepID=A0A447QU57_SERRU|nr:Uncharacterized conserved protein [Serratia rubidaea]